jgi:arginase
LGLGEPRLAGLYGETSKVKAQHVAFLGLRDIDPGEEQLLREHGIQRASSAALRSSQALTHIEKALDTVESAANGFILSFDVDVLDPTLAPGVSTPVPGGLSLEQLTLIFSRVARSPKLRAIEIVEYSPERDKDGTTVKHIIEVCRSLVPAGY